MIFYFLDMSEEQLNASLDAEGAKPLEEGAAEDVELTDEELAGVAGGNGECGQLTPNLKGQPEWVTVGDPGMKPVKPG